MKMTNVVSPILMIVLFSTAITYAKPWWDVNDGTTVRVYFQKKPDAKSYFIWCSPHADGRGAVSLTLTGAKSGILIGGLRPGLELHFWVVCQDAKGQMSKPSSVAKAVLVDQFKEK